MPRFRQTLDPNWDSDSLRTSLLALLRSILENDDNYRQIASGVSDWSSLLILARRQAVLGLIVHRALVEKKILPSELESDWQSRWAEARLEFILNNQYLAEVLNALNAKGINTVLMKGISLAERYYPDPTTRPFMDFDLLLGSNDLDYAIAALQPLGYELPDKSTLAYYKKAHHHIALKHAEMPSVELHFDAHMGFGEALPSNELLSRAISHRITTGAETKVLCAEDELLYLAVHAAGHRFSRLNWLVDLALIINKASPNLPTVIEQSKRTKAYTALMVSFHELIRLFARPDIPQPSRKKITRSALAQYLVEHTSYRDLPAKAEPLVQLFYNLCLTDSWPTAGHYLVKKIKTETERYTSQWAPKNKGSE